MEYLQNCLYINLNHRTDRCEHVEEQLSNMGIPGTRFSAIKMDDGAVGCTFSHIKCLEIAKEKGWEHVFICEDDIHFLDPETFKTSFRQFIDSGIEWDVILVAGNNSIPYQVVSPFCIKVYNCQTTTGYVVKREYYDTLISNYREGVTNLLRNPRNRREFALDIYWKRLQNTGKWFLITPITVSQLAGYSDIECRHTDYGALMTSISKEWLFQPRRQPYETNSLSDKTTTP